MQGKYATEEIISTCSKRGERKKKKRWIDNKKLAIERPSVWCNKEVRKSSLDPKTKISILPLR